MLITGERYYTDITDQREKLFKCIELNLVELELRFPLQEGIIIYTLQVSDLFHSCQQLRLTKFKVSALYKIR